jgi:3-oxoacyl-[acyl-carrier protein] reductase
VQREATPMARLATPEDVGTAVSAVVNHLPFTTGSIIPVDGGRQLGTS